MFLLKTRKRVDLSLITPGHPRVQRNGGDCESYERNGLEANHADNFRMRLREAGEEDEPPRNQKQHPRPEARAAMEVALTSQFAAKVLQRVRRVDRHAAEAVRADLPRQIADADHRQNGSDEL